MTASPVQSANPEASPLAGRARERVQLSFGDLVSLVSWPAITWIVAGLVVAPVAFLAASLLDPNTEVWRHQWETRLPGQLVQTVGLLAGVSVGTLVLGCALAWLTTAYRFPGSNTFGWLLIAPLAVPSYVLGFLTLSVFGYAGPIQSLWRSVAGPDAWFPPVRSLGAAIVAFTVGLYPYVYLLARAALADQAGSSYEVARSLGAGPVEAARRVVLPLLRPAIAAGTAVVMMETLTDFATVQYFNVDTVSVGVFRIWRGTFDRDAASEFATLVLAFALLVIGLERILRGRARYGQAAGRASGIEPRTLSGFKGWAATGACTFVVVAAFAAPVAQLVAWAVAEVANPTGVAVGARFWGYLQNSMILAAVTAGICALVAWLVANARRFGGRSARISARLTAVGYAVPGPVVAIGVILALVAVDKVLDSVGLGLPGVMATGSFLALAYAYSVRLAAPGLNAVESGLDQVPEDLTNTARSLGRRPLDVATRVHLPLARSSVITAVVLVAVDALKELPIVLLLRPFGFDTLSVWTYNLASESLYRQAALPAITVVVVALVPVGLLSRQVYRRYRTSGLEAVTIP